MVATSPSEAARQECAALLAELPDEVAGQDRREVSPADTLARAWGDPAIVLRCGVPKPAELRPDSPCFVVDKVGWLAVEGADDVVFSTVGRSTYVELTVPSDYAPEAGALVAVAPAITSTTTWPRPCT